MARHLAPDHDRGDEGTIGGYAAVHGRPPAFEGSDGVAYSVEVLADDTGDPGRRWGAYLLFVRWRRIGAPGAEGHLESDYIGHASTEQAALDMIRSLPLDAAKRELDRLIVDHMSEDRR